MKKSIAKKPTTNAATCFCRKIKGETPSDRHLGPVAEKIAIKPMIIRNITAASSVLSGGETIRLLILLLEAFRGVLL